MAHITTYNIFITIYINNIIYIIHVYIILTYIQKISICI